MSTIAERLIQQGFIEGFIEGFAEGFVEKFVGRLTLDRAARLSLSEAERVAELMSEILLKALTRRGLNVTTEHRRHIEASRAAVVRLLANDRGREGMCGVLPS